MAQRRRLTRYAIVKILALNFLLPVSLVFITKIATAGHAGDIICALLAIALIAPLGPYTYQIAFRPLGNAPVLTLLIAAVGWHWLMIGVGLVLFGAEGFRTEPFTDASVTIGPFLLSTHNLLILAVVVIVMVGLYLIFDRTLLGKALAAAAIDERGARLVGISPQSSGWLAFLLAAFIGALCGVLIASTTTIYFDSGFLIALKGFVAAIVGGFASYPLAVASAFVVGLTEAIASFWASAMKEVIVFSLIIPVLLVRSLAVRHAERD